MSTVSLTTLRAYARTIREYSPSLGMGSALSPRVRTDLRNLAIEAGLHNPAKANDADLISIYLVALKDAASAQRVAQRINMRLDDTLLTLPEPAPPPPIVREPWEQLQPPMPVSVDMATVRDMIKREVREGALDPLQTTLINMREELRADIDDVRADSLSRALTLMQDALNDAAHNAAVEALKSLTPTRLEISSPNNPNPVSLGLVHRDTAKIINALSAGVNVYLHGPAGSGKTTVAHKCAEAFSLEFRFAAKVESEYQLMGFKDAKGDTVRTQFRDAYEHGGVFLFDEMDASSPSAVVALNAALANGVCPFPDAIVKRHKDFYCIGAGNTKLTGANRQYAGRNQLDAASIDRFAFIEFGYDDELEMALAGDAAWARYVQRVRAIVAERGLNHLVTPRATYDGCKLLAQGFDRDTVAAMVVYKGLDADTVRQIQQSL